MKPFTRRLVGVVACAAVLAGVSGRAHAVEGVVLIDQARAIEGGVTAGDGPGFPVEINQPGSYRLSGNLTVANPNTTAIRIKSTNVTLDLNGFTIQGPPRCWQAGPHARGKSFRRCRTRAHVVAAAQVAATVALAVAAAQPRPAIRPGCTWAHSRRQGRV